MIAVSGGHGPSGANALRKSIEAVQESFLAAYGATPAESALLPVLKIKALLETLAQGRRGDENRHRKRVMWANIMRKFIRQAAQRSLEPAAA